MRYGLQVQISLRTTTKLIRTKHRYDRERGKGPLTVPCSRKQFGNPDYLRDESKELTLRVHDECNGRTM
jgi:hypothetical protein